MGSGVWPAWCCQGRIRVSLGHTGCGRSWEDEVENHSRREPSALGSDSVCSMGQPHCSPSWPLYFERPQLSSLKEGGRAGTPEPMQVACPVVNQSLGVG